MDKSAYPPLLPAGFHRFTLDELAHTFALPFGNSRRSPVLVDGLKRFVTKLLAMGVVGELWFDGSFVSTKIEPDDIDLVVVLDANAFSKLSAKKRGAIERAFDPTLARVMYKCDVYWVLSSDVAWVTYWRGWFGFQRDGKSPKGLGYILL